jgi:hypothetical protein
LYGGGLAQGSPAPERQPFGLLAAKDSGVVGEEQEVPEPERQVGDDAGSALVLGVQRRPLPECGTLLSSSRADIVVRPLGSGGGSPRML